MIATICNWELPIDATTSCQVPTIHIPQLRTLTGDSVTTSVSVVCIGLVGVALEPGLHTKGPLVMLEIHIRIRRIAEPAVRLWKTGSIKESVVGIIKLCIQMSS